MKPVYLDNAATTALDEEVLEEMMRFFKEDYGNASSIHKLGQASREAVDKAREIIAQFLNCSPTEIIFTASATESDNLAILGVKKGHIITTKIEHPAVLNTCSYLEKMGFEIDFCPVSKEGIVDVEEIKKKVKENTVLVSVMYANNEIGTTQPIAELGEFLKDKEIYFHTDAVQAVNFLDCDVKKLNVDLMTLSAHKIYGPKGIGALYVKKGVKLSPIMFGGHHENGLRPGTENVPYIVGFGKAIELVGRFKKDIPFIQKLRDKLIDGILDKIPDSKLNGSREKRLPNNVNVSFKGAEGESIVIALDQKGIASSTGSACSSGSLEPSHVLLALGGEGHGSLRLTLGRKNTEKEIDKVLKVLPKAVKDLRKVSGYL